MIKEIKYNGYSASPGDREAPEGDLSVAMNLIPEHATIRPVLPPKEKFSLPTGATLMCIHKTATYTNYIYHQAGNNALYKLDEDGTVPYDGGMIYPFGQGVTVFKVEPIGNTLVVLASDGVHYILNKNGAYHYLGTHLPELDIQFTAFGVQPRIKTQLPNGVYEFELGTEDQYQKVVRDKEIRSGICNAAMAAINAAFRGIAEKKLFMFPFFVRYAFRMYDGSLTMHSAPILIALPNDVPQVKMVWNVNNGVITPQTSGDGHERYYGCKIDPMVGYVLCKRAVDDAQLAALEPWSDIITKVAIFISPQFYTYEMDAKNDDIIIGEDITRVPAAKDQIAQISNNANFYLAAEYDIDKINDASNDKPWSSTARDAYYSARNLGKLNGFTQVNLDFEPTNDNIVTRTAMTDDYQSHDELLPTTATSSFFYNSRVNLANISRRLFNGFSPCCLWFDFDEAFSESTTSSGRHGWATGRTPDQNANPDYSALSLPCTCTVVVKTNDGREVVMASQQRQMYFYDDKKILWFYYPDENAVRAYFDIDGDKYEINLKKHSMLYGAYFFSLEEDMEQTPVQSIPVPSTDEQRIVEQPNKVYTSEVNNPFYFPVTGINSISSGNIMGICAAVRPVSTSQYGYADLYVFADNGIWTAKINEKGTYNNIDFATGDVCTNPASITQLETSVLFATARGIMLISGSQAQCISTDIDDDGQQIFNAGMIWGDLEVIQDLTGIDRQQLTVMPFRDFLGNGEEDGCRMLYDYRGQRVIVYNPGCRYAYIYSLESNKWGMMQSEIAYTIKAYPEALAVTRDGSLVNFSEEGDTQQVNAVLLTRPLALDLPDVHKTVDTIIQRGTFDHHDKLRSKPVQVAVYASTDLYHWHYIGSSRDHCWRGYSGTPYQWFRVALFLSLRPEESITGCSIQLEPRYTNRLR